VSAPAAGARDAGLGPRARRARTRVLQLSVVHAADDPRIFERECRTLRDAGFDVTYAVPAPVPGRVRSGVKLVALPQRSRRLRWTQWAPITALVARLRPHVVHVHDPELLTLLPALRPLVPRVVYDMHEYHSLDFASKYYVPEPLRPHAARAVAAAQRTLAGMVDGVVVVVEEQLELLGPLPTLRVALPNYPRCSRFEHAVPLPELAADPRLKLVHVGSLTRNRGITVMLDVLQKLADHGPADDPSADVVLYLGGRYYNPRFEAEVRARAADLGSDRVRLLGRIAPDDLPRYLASADVVWSPELATAQYQRPTVPTKLFEGMATGLAVLASELPGRAELVGELACGLTVEPGVDGHLAGLDRLRADRPETARMGARGRQAVRERYSWEIIEDRLIDFYERLCEGLPVD